LWSCAILTLLVLPAAYAMWRRGQVRRATRTIVNTHNPLQPEASS
jgi:hypothetical protein